MFQVIRSLFIEVLTFIRELKINPNKYSRIKIEEFLFNLSCEITIGENKNIQITDQPDTTIRPQVVTTNIIWPQFILLHEIKVANISAFVGHGSEDAYNYSPMNPLRKMDLPTLTPLNRATVLGEYTGMIPEGYQKGDKFIFTISFKGPSKLCD